MAARPRTRDIQGTGTRRTSVSLPAELHREIEQIARQKRVSVAWVIRDAVGMYVDGKWPLLSQRN